jgi:hypothetical protein
MLIEYKNFRIQNTSKKKERKKERKKEKRLFKF